MTLLGNETNKGTTQQKWNSDIFKEKYKTRFHLLLHQEDLLVLCVDLFVMNKLKNKRNK